jgi:hypothetical protein
MTPTLTPTETAARHHARAVRFFWGFLIGATLVSLIGNIVHAIWHLIPFVVIQIGTAAVPPLFLLAVVHGIALSVRADASGTVYRWAVTATGVPPAWAWLFPAIIDTAIGASTMMLVALGDKPARRAPRVSTHTPLVQKATQTAAPSAKPEFRSSARTGAQGTGGTSRTGAELFIGTTPAGADRAGLSTNGGTGGCRPCVGADCIRCDYTALRDCDCSAGCKR